MKNKKLIIGIIAFVVFLVAAVVAYNNLSEKYVPDEIPQSSQKNESQQEDTASVEEEKTPAPDFTVFDKDGEEVSLSSFEGKPVVINFWATWCGPCKSELPAFEAMYNKHKEDIQFLMVNLTDGMRETKEGVDSFVEEEGYTFPVFYDHEYSAAYAYSVSSVPLTVFVDEEGNIKNARVGAMNEQILSRYIDDLIGG